MLGALDAASAAGSEPTQAHSSCAETEMATKKTQTAANMEQNRNLILMLRSLFGVDARKRNPYLKHFSPVGRWFYRSTCLIDQLFRFRLIRESDHDPILELFAALLRQLTSPLTIVSRNG